MRNPDSVLAAKYPFLMIALAANLAVNLAVTPASAAEVQVSADWAKSSGRAATSLTYGLNVSSGFDPAMAGKSGQAAYKEGVTYMSPGIIRHHNWDMMKESSDKDGWLINSKSADARWDHDKIARALQGSYEYGPVRMMNIPAWPEGLTGGKEARLPANQRGKFAAFCADLVKAVNIEQKAAIRYWEITNERDDIYDANAMPELAAVILEAVDAMRAVDPTIKVGGPAFANPSGEGVLDKFMSAVGDKLDFISYHSYQNGNPGASNTSVWDGADIGGITNQVREVVSRYAKGKAIELFHNEFNISYAPPDEKMNNAVGAVFDALALVSLAESGVTGSMAWNEADGWYGKLDSDIKKRPAAHVYHLANTYFVGDVVTTSSSDEKRVKTFATHSARSTALLLVHRNDLEEDTVRFDLKGFDGTAPSNVEMHQVTETGITTKTVAFGELTSAAGLKLPPTSITALSLVYDEKVPAPGIPGTNAPLSSPTGSPSRNDSSAASGGSSAASKGSDNPATPATNNEGGCRTSGSSSLRSAVATFGTGLLALLLVTRRKAGRRRAKKDAL